MSKVHIKRFLEFVNENEKKWDKIEIEKNDTPKDGTINIHATGTNGEEIEEKNLDKDIVEDLKDVLQDDYLLKKAVTGEFKQPTFDKLIDDNLSKIRDLVTFAHESSKNGRTFGEDNPNTFNYVEVEGEGVNDIFAIIPDKGRYVGKGEVLLAAYYSNVRRLKIDSRGGEDRGDCGVYDNKGNLDAIIEVKSYGASFGAADTSRKQNKFKLFNSKTDAQVSNDILKELSPEELEGIKNYNPYIGGLAIYLYGIKYYHKDINRPLAFVVFDNPDSSSNMNGYNSLVINKNLSLDEIYTLLTKHVKVPNNCNKKRFFIKSEKDKLVLFDTDPQNKETIKNGEE